MYLHSLDIEGFRRISKLELRFQRGLNLIVGPNNAGKTAIIDALRVLLAAGDEGALRVTELDLHVPQGGPACTQATFRYVFRGLTADEEADFIQALSPYTGATGETEYEAVISVRYSNPTPGERLQVKRWAGQHEDTALTAGMVNDLRAVYLQPLRDPALGLRPGRTSQIARLVQSLSEPAHREEVVDVLRRYDEELKGTSSIKQVHAAITKRHTDMLGMILSQNLDVSLTPSDFRRVSSRLGLLIAAFEVEQNGLGFNNLIYMAVVLSELSLSRESAYRALLVEEPEAHLHPQLQSILLSYLKTVESPEECEKGVQVFLTSHSPHFASQADLESIACVYDKDGQVDAFLPREVSFEKRKKEKLQRYLNVTRAELFFARRIILVEGAAELFIVEAMAHLVKCELRKHAVSIISVDGLNFDAFLPLFGPDQLSLRVAILTDSDENGFPSLGEPPKLSANAKILDAAANACVRPFFGARTLEYAIAQIPENQATMLAALKTIHPGIAAELAETLKTTLEADKPRVLFQGIFDRGENKTKVKKGEFAQALANAVLDDKLTLTVPGYIADAFEFVCEP